MSASSSVAAPTAELFVFSQSDALLRKVVESSSVGTAVAGRDGTVVYVNPAFTAMTGLGVGICLHEIPHPDEAERFSAAVAAVVAGADEFSDECLMTRADGSSFWSAANVAALRNSGAETTHVIVQLTDIDRAKRAEAMIAETESRWNAALEGARQGVWDFDGRTGRTFYSRVWRVMRGYGPDEEVDDSREAWLSRVHPEDRARIEGTIGAQNRGEDGFDTIEYRERHRDGHWIWILSRGKPVEWDENGEAVRTIGTDMDITAIRDAEAALAAEKDLLATTMKSVADGMVSTDRHGSITFMNPSAERLVGWPAGEAVGRPVEEIVRIEAGDGSRLREHPVSDCLRDSVARTPEGDFRMVARDGRRIDIRFSAAPVIAPDGTVMASVLVFQDMTYNKSMQKELEYAASHDSLTGLGNRMDFERALAAVPADGGTHAVCFVDLDRFKAVNDTGGHAAGDAVLVQVAGILRSSCREGDTVARIGGDEFAFLMPECSLENAVRAAWKVVDAISGRRFVHEGQVHSLGASIGVAAYDPAKDTPASAMGRADVACYTAKSAGRNRVCH